jgi:hypothetical protein
MRGLLPGPLDALIAYHFKPNNLGAEDVGTLCIDSAFIPPAGAFVYAYTAGYSVPNISGPFCWPVKNTILGDFDMDGEITVGDPVELVKYIFKGKPAIGPVEVGDANCDGATNIGDIIYLIAYIFKHGPAPGCP